MIEKNTLLREVEMQRAYSEIRLEPHLSPESGESPALLSIAISLKRIADQGELFSPEDRIEVHKIRMVSIYYEKLRGNSMSMFADTMRRIDGFFKAKRP